MSNDSQLEKTYESYSRRPETYIVPVIFFAIFVVGIIGNGLVIHVFCRHKEMRTVPNKLILNLAIGDMLVLLISVPFIGTIYTIESWPFGTVVCKLSESIKDLSTGVSVFTLVALSADRYKAIVYPMRKFVGRSHSKIMIATIVTIWVSAVIIATPTALFTHVATYVPNATDKVLKKAPEFNYCFPFPGEYGKDPWYPKMIVICKATILYFIPLSSITVLYTIMSRRLFQSIELVSVDVEATTIQAPVERARESSRRKVAKLVLFFVLCFAVCFLPFHIFSLWFFVFSEDPLNNFNNFWNYFRITGFCLVFANSCINPIALYFISDTFKLHFKNVLMCKRVSTGNNSRFQSISNSMQPKRRETLTKSTNM